MKYGTEYCGTSIAFTPFMKTARGRCKTVISRVKINLNAEGFLKTNDGTKLTELYRKRIY